MKYTVTIKDNESGKIVREVECNSIVGGVSFDDEKAASIGIANCDGIELLGACKAAKKTIYKVLEGEDALRIMFTLFEMSLIEEIKGNKQDKEDTENA